MFRTCCWPAPQDFLHIVEVLFDRRAVDEGFDNLYGRGVRIGREEGISPRFTVSPSRRSSCIWLVRFYGGDRHVGSVIRPSQDDLLALSANQSKERRLRRPFDAESAIPMT